MTNQKIIEGLVYLSTNKRINLVHGVLKQLNLSPLHDCYDDYFQEGCLIFSQAYASFPDDPTDPENERQLMNFAFKRIYWRLLDLLRRQVWEKEHWLGSMDDESLDETTINRFTNDPNSQNDFNRLENSDFFSQLNACCSPNEKRYLHDVLFADLKDAEIAAKYNVTRQAVYSWKRGLINKARSLNWHK